MTGNSSDSAGSICNACGRAQRQGAQFCASCGGSVTDRRTVVLPSQSLIPWIAGGATTAVVLLLILIVLMSRDEPDPGISAGSDPATTATTQLGAEDAEDEQQTSIAGPAESQPESLPTHTELNGRFGYGDRVAGEIEIPDDYDKWLFEGRDGEVVTIEMATGDINRNVYLKIYDSGGWRRAGTDCTTGLARILNYELNRDDTFEVHAGSCEGSTGRYELVLSEKVLSGIVDFDATVTGELVLADDYDLWAFEGLDDQVVTVEMATGDITRNIYLELYDSGGWRRAKSDCTTDLARILNYKLNGDGTFYIHAGSCEASTGPYEMSLTKK